MLDCRSGPFRSGRSSKRLQLRHAAGHLHPALDGNIDISGIDVAAAVSAAVFIAVLAVTAYWDPSIRVLHVFESLPYLLAAVLCLRQSKLGYALGFVSGAFWLWTGGLLTTFIRNGFERLEMLSPRSRVVAQIQGEHAIIVRMNLVPEAAAA